MADVPDLASVNHPTWPLLLALAGETDEAARTTAGLPGESAGSGAGQRMAPGGGAGGDDRHRPAAPGRRREDLLDPLAVRRPVRDRRNRCRNLGLRPRLPRAARRRAGQDGRRRACTSRLPCGWIPQRVPPWPSAPGGGQPTKSAIPASVLRRRRRPGGPGHRSGVVPLRRRGLDTSNSVDGRCNSRTRKGFAISPCCWPSLAATSRSRNSPTARDGRSSGLELADRTAIAAYRRRLIDLEEERSDAEAMHDPARAERAASRAGRADHANWRRSPAWAAGPARRVRTPNGCGKRSVTASGTPLRRIEQVHPGTRPAPSDLDSDRHLLPLRTGITKRRWDVRAARAGRVAEPLWHRYTECGAAMGETPPTGGTHQASRPTARRTTMIIHPISSRHEPAYC